MLCYIGILKYFCLFQNFRIRNVILCRDFKVFLTSSKTLGFPFIFYTVILNTFWRYKYKDYQDFLYREFNSICYYIFNHFQVNFVWLLPILFLLDFEVLIWYNLQKYHKNTTSKNGIIRPLSLLLSELWPIHWFQEFTIRILCGELFGVFFRLGFGWRIFCIEFFIYIENLYTFARASKTLGFSFIF